MLCLHGVSLCGVYLSPKQQMYDVCLCVICFHGMCLCVGLCTVHLHGTCLCGMCLCCICWAELRTFLISFLFSISSSQFYLPPPTHTSEINLPRGKQEWSDPGLRSRIPKGQ